MSKRGPKPRPVEERFFEKVEVAHPADCWLWTGAKKSGGYGKFFLRRIDNTSHSVLAHRWSYEYFRGAIPDGLVLDHLCRNPPCVNPDHLECVTIGDNTRRGHAGKWLRRAP